MILVRNSSPAKHATRHLHHQMVCFIIKELIVERDHSTAKDVTSHSQSKIFLINMRENGKLTHAKALQRITQTTEKIADFVQKLLKLTHLLKQL